MKDKNIKKTKLIDCRNPLPDRVGKVGGEAVLEGVMMRGTGQYSVAVRREDGSISVTTKEWQSVRKKHKILNIPIVRGVVGMVESMILSFKVLGVSAEAYGGEAEAEPSRFEKWLDRHFGKSIMDLVMVIATIFGVALAVGLFVFLPSLATKGIDALTGKAISESGAWKWTLNLIEGVLKILIFIGYLLAVSLMKDIRRTFEYHGAEHKSIFCYEAGEELTPENAAKFKRFHPRCGTSFLFIVMIISILIFSLPFVPWDNVWLRVLVKLPLIPVVMGVGFEFIMLTGKHNNRFTRALSAPGRWMQRITTREPDLEQLEIAITALKNALPDQFPEAAAEAEAMEAEYQAKKAAEKAAAEAGENGKSADETAETAETTETAETAETEETSETVAEGSEESHIPDDADQA